jgi:hypothetical protein
LFALINGVPTVYETLSAADGKGAGAGKSGGKNGGSEVGAGGNGAKGAGKGGAKRQKPDPVRLRACSTTILAGAGATSRSTSTNYILTHVFARVSHAHRRMHKDSKNHQRGSSYKSTSLWTR